MSIYLKPVSFSDVSKYFWEFQKKSDCFELPPDESELLGIFSGDQLVGYFILIGRDHIDVEVEQGYLLPEFRHLGLPKECIKQMEDLCRAAGYKTINIATRNRFKAYTEFMQDNGYEPIYMQFNKEL